MDGTVLSVHEGPHAGDLHHDSAPNPLGVDGSRVDKPAHCTDADATKLSSGLLQVPEQGFGTHQPVLRNSTNLQKSGRGVRWQRHFECYGPHVKHRFQPRKLTHHHAICWLALCIIP